MFPLNDFNFMCCALATFSAAVGYNVSRKRRCSSVHRHAGSEKAHLGFLYARTSISRTSCSSDIAMDTEGTEPPPSSCPSPSENAHDDVEPGTRKRKHRGEDEEDDVDLVPGRFDVSVEPRSPSPPRKRCRTPSVPAEVKMEEAEPVKLEPALPAPAMLPESGRHVKLEDVTVDEKTAPVRHAVPVLLPSSYSIPAVKPSSAFTAFTNSRSAFALAPNVHSGTQPPIWSSVISTCESTSRSDAPTASGEELEQQLSAKRESAEAQASRDPLAAHTYVSKEARTILTGEEDESVQAELKGAKVFIKRGTHEFSDGILGHVKLLARKDNGEQRILFRREPIWKVSMSVRLCSAVRCTFDEEQGILRVALRESELRDGAQAEEGVPQITVYALKRGKASRSDFAVFARTVVETARLPGQASPVSLQSPTATA